MVTRYIHCRKTVNLLARPGMQCTIHFIVQWRRTAWRTYFELGMLPWFVAGSIGKPMDIEIWRYADLWDLQFIKLPQVTKEVVERVWNMHHPGQQYLANAREVLLQASWCYKALKWADRCLVPVDIILLRKRILSFHEPIPSSVLLRLILRPLPELSPSELCFS